MGLDECDPGHETSDSGLDCQVGFHVATKYDWSLSIFWDILENYINSFFQEMEETYTSSLFQTEPLYQFYDNDPDKNNNNTPDMSPESSHSTKTENVYETLDNLKVGTLVLSPRRQTINMLQIKHWDHFLTLFCWYKYLTSSTYN